MEIYYPVLQLLTIVILFVFHTTVGIVFAAKTGTITMGIQQHYPRTQPTNEDANYASLPAELSSFTSSTFEPRQERIPESPKKNSMEQHRRPRPNESLHEVVAGNRRKIGSTDVFGQNMENLVQLEDPANNRKFQVKSLDEIREEPSRRHARSVLGLESLIVGLEGDLQEHYSRNVLRRNQSFDHARYHLLIGSRQVKSFSVPSLLLVPLIRRHDARQVYNWKVRREVSYKLFKMHVSTRIISE